MVKKIGKTLQKFFAKRNIILLVLFTGMASVLISRLVQLQIIQGNDYQESFTVRTTATRTLKSTRGRIYDCNGKLLAYNELASAVTIEDNGTYETSREKNLSLNGEIYRLAAMITSNGDSLSHDFHITVDEHGNYAFDTTNETTLARFKADVFGYRTVDELSEKEAKSDAQEMMTTLMGAERYALVNEDKPYTEEELAAVGLPQNLTKEEALAIVVVRYQLSLVSYQRYMAVTVASNVSEATVAVIEENSDSLQGVSISEDYIRVYNNSIAMAPIIGYTGKPSADELETLQQQDKKYTSNSIIGKSGIEQSLETTLQGTDGEEEVTIDNLGKVVAENKDSRKDPVQGNDVYLTIDSELQDALYKILEQRIAGILVLNMVDAKTVDVSDLADNDMSSVASYDCYYAMIDNNVLNIQNFANENASDTEKAVYAALEKKQAEVKEWLNSELSSDQAWAYNRQNEEQKAYLDYLINNFLTEQYGILNESEINTEDSTYQAYVTDGSISTRTFLMYAANNGWIDVTKLPEVDNAYMTSEEIYQNVITFMENHIAEETQFNKLLYKYMLLNDEITPAQIMTMLYDQGILSKDDGVYENFASGKLSPLDLLTNKISSLQITPAMLALDPCSGSIVITEPTTGAVKACVTYPGYDNNRLANDMDVEYFNKLNTDKSTPFYNKATQQLTAPGSTFKPVMAAAGMAENLIDEESLINCTGTFGEDLEFLSDSDRVHCWYTNGHGPLNVFSALENSCNVFFCTIGFRMGQDTNGNYDQSRALLTEQKYAAKFGLDKTTNIQIPESEPSISDSMPIPSSIGQGTHQYTTTELARYVSTIAVNGQCFNLNLVQQTTTPAGAVLTEMEPQKLIQADFQPVVWEKLQEGMGAAVSSDTAWSDFSNDVFIYGKTGTAQESMLRPDHALVVGFTRKQSSSIKYDDVAFAVRVANGYSSRNASLIAKDAMNYYFNLVDESEVLTGTANTTDMSRKNVTD